MLLLVCNSGLSGSTRCSRPYLRCLISRSKWPIDIKNEIVRRRNLLNQRTPSEPRSQLISQPTQSASYEKLVTDSRSKAPLPRISMHFSLQLSVGLFLPPINLG